MALIEIELAIIIVVLLYIYNILNKLHDFFRNEEWDKTHPDVEA